MGAVQYTVTGLGTLNGYASSDATAINAKGQVVGEAISADGTSWVPFLYSKGKMTNLGTTSEGGVGTAYAINNHGVAAGEDYSTGNSWYHASMYTSGHVLDLYPNSQFEGAYGINDNLQVVGYCQAGNNGTYGYSLYHPCLYDVNAGEFTDLGLLPGYESGSASAINNNGQIVGTCNNEMGTWSEAFIYSNGQMTDLGKLPGTWSSAATALNANGQIVGTCYSEGFFYSNGVMTDLGNLPGYRFCTPEAINDSGQVVGCIQSDSVASAFIYSSGTMVNLNTLISPSSQWSLISATGINDAGQIVGYGTDPAGAEEAFLLTPVPEPSTLALLGIGAATLLAYAWRRRMA